MNASIALRRAAVAVAAAWCLATGGPAAAATPPAGPTVVPSEEFALSDLAGHVVVLDFWASWCKPCGQALPWLSALQRAHGDAGLRVVAVNVDKKLAKAQPMIATLDPGVLVVLDPAGKLAADYDLQGMPSTFVIDRRGEVVADHVGFLPAEADAREAEIVALLNAAAEGKEGKEP